MIRQFGEDTALLLIDVQKGVNDAAYYGGKKGERNNPGAEANQIALLKRWRDLQGLVAFTCHDSIEPNSPLKLSLESGQQLPGLEINEGEIKIVKDVNSGFIGTSLEIDLRRRKINRLVIAGFFTNHCVETTTRMAGNMGFDCYLIHDACATMDSDGIDGRHFDAETVHGVSLASMHGEFCTAITTEQALGLMQADNPSLHRVQGNEW